MNTSILNSSEIQNTQTSHGLQPVTKNEPCRHCGKPDWCYRLGNLEVCKRDALAEGWHKTSKADHEGSYYLALTELHKPVRSKQKREWIYNDRNGNPLVKVVRRDDGKGKKKIWQERYENGSWVKGLGNIKRENIPVYRYL
ncbi:hypothetical protein BZZ01_32445 [Nostocales cyanobacterium HT-58-2]|nr:hypothetical protein BZZ01_32445 [Nostocales cyanobacterium HT-58-2]